MTEIEELRQKLFSATEAMHVWKCVADEQKLRINAYREALELIAAPVRPDGTYNRSREACEELARKALSRQEHSTDMPRAMSALNQDGPGPEGSRTSGGSDQNGGCESRQGHASSSDEAMKIDSYTYQNDHGQHPDGHCSKCRSWRVCKCDSGEGTITCSAHPWVDISKAPLRSCPLCALPSSDSCSGCLDGKHSWVTCFGNTYCCDCDAKPDSKEST